MAWMKDVESADQPLLVLFGVWHHEQVVPSFRWPAWKASSVNAPSSRWQALQRWSSTIARRPLKPVATFCTSGATTIRPPVFSVVTTVEAVVPKRGLRFGSDRELSARFVCVRGMVVFGA